jgi:hypothetical protein
LWKTLGSEGDGVSGKRLKGAVSEGLGASLHPLRACSACAGDYEDPDRTAWPLDVENAEVEAEIEIEEEVNPEVGPGDANAPTHEAQWLPEAE